MYLFVSESSTSAWRSLEPVASSSSAFVSRIRFEKRQGRELLNPSHPSSQRARSVMTVIGGRYS